jgi:putative flippase GtrA
MSRREAPAKTILSVTESPDCTIAFSKATLLPNSFPLAPITTFWTTLRQCNRPANGRSLWAGITFQLLRFGLVGGAATIMHIAVATALLSVFPQVQPVTANVAAFLVAFVVSFVGHSRFTFKQDGSLPKFLVAALLGLCANNAVLVALLAMGASAIPSLWVATLAAPLVVYLVSKFWVFPAHA